VLGNAGSMKGRSPGETTSEPSTIEGKKRVTLGGGLGRGQERGRMKN
jgi:hypothetical protein